MQVIASWWDYGYWISTLGERKSLADNATLLDWQIRKIAAMYMSTPENAWQILTADVKTDVGKYYVTLPLDTQATSLEERNLEVFGEWRVWDDDNDGIINAEEVDTWWAEGENDCLKTTWTCPKFTQNPGTISQYPTVFDYWNQKYT